MSTQVAVGLLTAAIDTIESDLAHWGEPGTSFDAHSVADARAALASLAEAARGADEAASVAHDFVYGLNDVTQEQASAAIWRIHNVLRPLFVE